MAILFNWPASCFNDDLVLIEACLHYWSVHLSQEGCLSCQKDDLNNFRHGYAIKACYQTLLPSTVKRR